jgi:hypothetical protein
MTMNRLLTSVIQLFLWLPVLWYVREVIKEKRNKS